MKEEIKNYFEYEVKQISTPPFPSSKKKTTIKPWETILLTALALASMVIVYLPGSYNSTVRTMVISENVKESLKKDFTRVIQNVDLYYNQKRSLYE